MRFLALKERSSFRPIIWKLARALASLLEETASSEALIHRQKLIDLQPQLLEPKLAYVRSALRLGHLQQASKTLKSIKGSLRKTRRVQVRVQAELQLKRDRPDGALEIYRELIDLRPKDERTRVKLTALELRERFRTRPGNCSCGFGVAGNRPGIRLAGAARLLRRCLAAK